ncbi:hypothetical protein TRVL_04120 [Trypanosoma vivax]|nr:hypothetical protein TRVL_04120 [Trypanosoma vivax]
MRRSSDSPNTRGSQRKLMGMRGKLVSMLELYPFRKRSVVEQGENSQGLQVGGELYAEGSNQPGLWGQNMQHACVSPHAACTSSVTKRTDGPPPLLPLEKDRHTRELGGACTSIAAVGVGLSSKSRRVVGKQKSGKQSRVVDTIFANQHTIQTELTIGQQSERRIPQPVAVTCRTIRCKSALAPLKDMAPIEYTEHTQKVGTDRNFVRNNNLERIGYFSQRMKIGLFPLIRQHIRSQLITFQKRQALQDAEEPPGGADDLGFQQNGLSLICGRRLVGLPNHDRSLNAVLRASWNEGGKTRVIARDVYRRIQASCWWKLAGSRVGMLRAAQAVGIAPEIYQVLLTRWTEGAGALVHVSPTNAIDGITGFSLAGAGAVDVVYPLRTTERIATSLFPGETDVITLLHLARQLGQLQMSGMLTPREIARMLQGDEEAMQRELQYLLGKDKETAALAAKAMQVLYADRRLPTPNKATPSEISRALLKARRFLDAAAERRRKFYASNRNDPRSERATSSLQRLMRMAGDTLPVDVMGLLKRTVGAISKKNAAEAAGHVSPTINALLRSLRRLMEGSGESLPPGVARALQEALDIIAAVDAGKGKWTGKPPRSLIRSLRRLLKDSGETLAPDVVQALRDTLNVLQKLGGVEDVEDKGNFPGALVRSLRHLLEESSQAIGDGTPREMREVLDILRALDDLNSEKADGELPGALVESLKRLLEDFGDSLPPEVAQAIKDAMEAVEDILPEEPNGNFKSLEKLPKEKRDKLLMRSEELAGAVRGFPSGIMKRPTAQGEGGWSSGTCVSDSLPSSEIPTAHLLGSGAASFIMAAKSPREGLLKSHKRGMKDSGMIELFEWETGSAVENAASIVDGERVSSRHGDRQQRQSDGETENEKFNALRPDGPGSVSFTLPSRLGKKWRYAQSLSEYPLDRFGRSIGETTPKTEGLLAHIDENEMSETRVFESVERQLCASQSHTDRIVYGGIHRERRMSVLSARSKPFSTNASVTERRWSRRGSSSSRVDDMDAGMSAVASQDLDSDWEPGSLFMTDDDELALFLATFPNERQHVQLHREARRLLDDINFESDLLVKYVSRLKRRMVCSTPVGTPSGLRCQSAHSEYTVDSDEMELPLKLNANELRQHFEMEAREENDDLWRTVLELRERVAQQEAFLEECKMDLYHLTHPATGDDCDAFALKLTREVNAYAKEHNLDTYSLSNTVAVHKDHSSTVRNFIDNFAKGRGTRGTRNAACQCTPDDLGYVDPEVQHLNKQMEDLHFHVSGLMNSIKLTVIAVGNVLSFHAALELEATCKLCFCIFEEPRTLWPCGHTFCQQCLVQMISKHGELICDECGTMCVIGYTPNLALDMVAGYQAMRRSTVEIELGVDESDDDLGDSVHSNSAMSLSAQSGHVATYHRRAVETVLGALLNDLMDTDSKGTLKTSVVAAASPTLPQSVMSHLGLPPIAQVI